MSQNRMIKNIQQGRGRRPFPWRWLLAAAVALPLAGCDVDSLLDVPDPDVATPGSLDNPAGLPVLLAGAIGDFQVAYTGTSAASNSPEGIINMSGLLADEWIYVSTFPTRIEVDQRTVQRTNSTMETIHRNVQRARASAERAAEAYARLSPNAIGRAEALNLAGFSYVLLSESYCSGVPISSLTATGVAQFGPPLTSDQLYERAVAKFDTALTIANAAGSGAAAVTQQNMAKVGRGRALLNLNRAADAAMAVAGVPTNFVYNISNSENTGRQQNGIFVLNQVGRRVSVTDREGDVGLPYRSSNDPRVPQARGTGNLATSDQGFPLFLELKYPARAADVVLASGVEARLIEAEAALRTPAGGNYLQILNALRASPPSNIYPTATYPRIASLTSLTDPGTQAARVDLLFQERAYWTWLTSHRLGDMRRLIRQYNRPQQSVFPSGAYFRGGEYGPDVNFPIPVDEENNPGAGQCIDRNA
ncbi:hypothetical protein BH23GEM5_BH23GEM5_21910 [soil metagenome]